MTCFDTAWFQKTMNFGFHISLPRCDDLFGWPQINKSQHKVSLLWEPKRDDHVTYVTLLMGSQIEVSIREDLGRRARAEFMSNDEADEALTIAPRVCA